MNFEIREFLPKDALEVAKLNNRVWRSAYAGIFPDIVFDKRDAEVDEKAKKLAVKVDGINRFVAVDDDGKIVGMMFFSYKSKIEKFAGFGELLVLYVDNFCQANGIGAKLFEFFKNCLKQNGVKKFCVGVLKDNKIGRKAYDKWGGKVTDYETTFDKYGYKAQEVYYEFDV